MTWNPSTPVTGAAQTGFTTPTYTLTADLAPDVNAKQHAVTALGGTQTGVSVHSVASPFTVTFAKPKNFRVLGKPHPVTGLISSVPMNQYKMIVRKGVVHQTGQPNSIARCTVLMDVPAGSDTVSPAELRGMMSLAAGILSQQSAGVGDTVTNGLL